MNIKDFNPPDYNFSPVLLDKKESGCPLPRLNKENGFNQPGVYAWYDGDTGEVLYVGKALKMRNRLQGHWYGEKTGFIGQVLADGIVPAVAVWLCDDAQRAGIERAMIDAALPRFNKRRD